MFTDFRLEVFMSVARTGNFTAASRAMGVSQPAISQNISTLEQALGEKLFERGRGAGNVSLTPEGEQFKHYAERILYWYGQVQTVMIEKIEKQQEPVSLTLSDGRQVAVSTSDDEIRIRIV